MKNTWRQEADVCLTHEVALPAEEAEPLELMVGQLRLRLSGRLVQPLLPSEHPVRSRVDDGELEQVQSRS